MRFEFTVRAPGGDCDVAVDTPIAVRLDEVRSRLLAAVGAHADSSLHSVGIGVGVGGGAGSGAGVSEIGVEGGTGVEGGGPTLRTGAVLSLDAPPARPPRRPDHALTVHVIGGRDAGTTHPLLPGRTSIGRDAHCRIVLNDDAVSREHATLQARPAGVLVLDQGSTNGTSVEGDPVDASGHGVRPGEVVRIGDTLLTLRGDDHVRAGIVPDGDRCLVAVAPRESPAPESVVLEMAPPPSRTRPRPTQWLAAVLPAAAGGGLAWFTHSPAFLLFALLSPVMLLGSALGDRLHWRRSRRREQAEHRRRGASDEQALRTALRAEAAQRRSRFPDPPAVAAAATMPTTRLWERRPADPDLLCVRVGSADLPSHTQVRSDGDPRPAAVLPTMPLVVDLRDGPLGVVGPPEAIAGLVRSLITQLAVLHPPSGVRMAIVVHDPCRSSQWSWTRWLPHLEGRGAPTPVERHRLLGELFAAPPTHAAPWTVVVVDARSGRTGAAVDLIAGDEPQRTAIVLAETAAELPGWCTRVLDVSRPETAATAVGAAGELRGVILDEVREDWAEGVARALAPFAEATPSTAAALPRSCHLLDVGDLAEPTADEVRARWAADDGRAGTVLAVGVDGPVEVDLARDGPHVLVAGTTGSGKSELLRSLVLGLALTHPPEALSFVLVDFKGGAAFADCSGLPHVVGSVTDLDPMLTRRALHSLKAELRRRELLFATVGAADLDGYRNCRPEVAVARLVIVVDEFAALADELPDFLRGVVSVAQRGRSLGVHLVLATQRPGSAVTAEIRANTALRIALRVVDAAESHEIVGVPDAAAIPPGVPGRAVLRLGDSTALVQTACVDAIERTRSTDLRVERLGPWRGRLGPRPAGNGCARIVQTVCAAERSRGVTPPAGPWLPPLPESVHADTLSVTGPGRIALGVLDLPAEQRQPTLELDLAVPTSWLIVGGARTGRTTTLASVALGAAQALGPSDLEIYVIDGGGELARALEGLPHVASCLGPDELPVAPTLLRRLTARAAGAAQVLLLVDHGERVLIGDDDVPLVSAAALAELHRRARAGVLVAGSRTLLAARVAGGFDHRLVLRLPDRADYALAGIAGRDVPQNLPPGRALRLGDGAEVQLAHRGSAPGPAAAADLAGSVAQRSTGRPSSTAVRLRPLPRRVRLTDLPAPASQLRLGRVGDGSAALSIDPFAGSRRWLVAGPARSGRTTTLLTLLAEARRTGTPVLVAAPARSPLRTEGAGLGLRVVSPGSEAGDPPRVPTLILVDDVETFTGSPCSDQLAAWADDLGGPCSFVVAGRSDELAASYLGPAASVRRARSGLLLQPGPLDGDLFGVRLGRTDDLPPGRGLVIGEPVWTASVPEADASCPMAIQVAIQEELTVARP